MPDQIDEDPSLEQDQQRTPAHDQPAEQPESAGRRLGVRDRRVGLVAALAVAATVAVVLATSSGGARVQPASSQRTTEAQRITARLAGIPQSGNALGSPAAPVTLQYFGIWSAQPREHLRSRRCRR